MQKTQLIIFGAVGFFTVAMMLAGMMKSRRSPLMDAAFRGDGRRVAGLLKGGADINATNATGATALTLAAQNGHKAVVSYLLSKGAGVNAIEGAAKTNKAGMTALMHAAQQGHAEIVKMLLEKGADTKVKTSLGQTALMLAAFKGKAPAVQALIDGGADVHEKDPGGLKAWNWAQNGPRDPETLAILKKITLKEFL
ncbi:MAG: ankyrin repeat domain-containing protein [Alphaproteobacteria bacterium]